MSDEFGGIVSKNSQNNQNEKRKQMQEIEQTKFEDALKILGFSIENENKKAILNYSQAVGNFRDLLNQTKKHYSALATYFEDDNSVQAHIKDLDKDWQEISQYFETLMSFFINPPSKEIFELCNHGILIESVYKNFSKYSNQIESLKINEQLSGVKKDFETHIKVVKDFQSVVESNLENMSKTYDEFLTGFLNKQTKEIENFNKKSFELSKTYDDFLQKNLKFFKGGTWSLIILNIALAIVLGILGAYVFVKQDELKNITAVAEQFAEVKVDKKSLTLNFPQNAQIIDNGEIKQVILKKD